eukprot:TRINITY_DN14082_c0_g1_i1.p1 TRINITY_DN14082_c0_g1~~TRINITY_DN14082_c0_g1_i1.p1  ORF type:complete len:273 (+),score=55.22 TRINITY_DN14082_c0_g1_i1:21-839(+)
MHSAAEMNAEGVSVSIAVVGEERVGKTAVLVRFMTGIIFRDWYSHTCREETYSRFMDIDRTSVRLQLLDTVTGKDSRELRAAEGFLVLYAVNDARSLEGAREHAMRVLQLKNKSPGEVAMVVCGNKADVKREQCQVSGESAACLARELGAELCETSAKTPLNIEGAFEMCAWKVVRIREKGTEKGRFIEREAARRRAVFTWCALGWSALPVEVVLRVDGMLDWTRGVEWIPFSSEDEKEHGEEGEKGKEKGKEKEDKTEEDRRTRLKKCAVQ